MNSTTRDTPWQRAACLLHFACRDDDPSRSGIPLSRDNFDWRQMSPATTPPLLAFIHGGSHHAGCWDDAIAALRLTCPTIRIMTVSMPGRLDEPGDLATLTIEQCVAACCEQIARARRDGEDVVLVGHSLAGVLMPGLARRLEAGSVRRAIFVACCVPPPGHCVVDTLPTGLHWLVRRIVRRTPVIEAVPWVVLRFFFGNGTTRSERDRIRAVTCAESAALLVETPTATWPESIAVTWILPTRDRAQPAFTQRRSMAALGGVTDVRTIDAGHDVMITAPAELARVLLDVIG